MPPRYPYPRLVQHNIKVPDTLPPHILGRCIVGTSNTPAQRRRTFPENNPTPRKDPATAPLYIPGGQMCRNNAEIPAVSSLRYLLHILRTVCDLLYK